MNQSPDRPSGYPLMGLFLVLTACGVVAGILSPLMRAISAGQVPAQRVGTAGGLSVIAVMVLGAVVGAFHYRRRRGIAWGMFLGGILGLFTGPLAVVPREAAGIVLGFSCSGAVIIVLMTAAFQVASRRSRRERS